MRSYVGGCMCGAVRYQLLSEPYDAGWCHCTTCRRFSGAPAVAFATVSVDHWQALQGQEAIRSVRSSTFGQRTFCGRCGTGLTIHVDHQADEIDFAICTLDEPDAVPPGFHIFYGSKVGWFETADALPRHERFRPNTRGLEGTEPPGA